jgi:hypothetical protein
MVRYREIVRETRVDPRSDSEIRATLMDSFDIDGRAIVNKNGTVDVTGDCRSTTNNVPFQIIPVKFNKTGDFRITHKILSSLEGCPKIAGNFSFNATNLTSLQYSPKLVSGNYICYDGGSLSSLEGVTPKIGSNLCFYRNPSITLEQISKLTCETKLDIILNYYKDLALLRLLHPTFTNSVKQIRFEDEPDPPAFIIVQKYLKKILVEKLPWKKAMIDCQYELIKSGFKGNAKW